MCNREGKFPTDILEIFKKKSLKSERAKLLSRFRTLPDFLKNFKNILMAQNKSGIEFELIFNKLSNTKDLFNKYICLHVPLAIIPLCAKLRF